MSFNQSVVTDSSEALDEQFLPAGNLARGLAFLIDALVCLAISIATIYCGVFVSVLILGNEKIATIDTLASSSAILLCCLYFALSYSSSHQASLGKKLMGLVVITHDGLRLSRVMAIGRVLVPVTIFALGYVLVLGYIFWLVYSDPPGSTESSSTSVAAATLLLFYLAFFAPYMTVFFSKNA